MIRWRSRASTGTTSAGVLERVVWIVGGNVPEQDHARRVPELEDPAVREVFLARHRIVYEVFENRVVVLRLLHGSRDLLLA